MDEGVGEGGGAGSAHNDWGDVEVLVKWIEEGVGVGGIAASDQSSLRVFVEVGVNGRAAGERVGAVVVGEKVLASGDRVGVVAVVGASAARIRFFASFRRLSLACRTSCRRRIS